MFNKLGYNPGSYQDVFAFQSMQINNDDTGNDFEKIAFKESSEIKEIIDFFETLSNVIFTRMTGSGSCCYAVFEKKEYALKANEIFKSYFPDIWSYVCENNTIID